MFYNDLYRFEMRLFILARGGVINNPSGVGCEQIWVAD